LMEAGQDYKEIDFIFLTHFHADHIAEVNSIIGALNWTPNFDRKKELFLIGPVGLKERCDNGIFKTGTEPNTFEVKIKEIKEELSFDDFEVETIKTVHSLESVAYKFSEENKNIVITGDCGYDRLLIKFANETDLLLIECTLPNEIESHRHLSSRQCGEIAKESKAKKVVLTHLSSSYLPEKVILPEVREVFPGAILGEDLMKFDI
ncbi:MAG: MBL fold metallo-hydrolase, partial [Candidatus Moranbacteria bacterium]|nr:MBL fold metallo-hydrolase [Candidatus Moranbacteria bacterium]